MGLYDAIDLDWFWDGDYGIGDDNDLKDTSDDYIRSLENDIMTVMKGEIADWQLHPTLAASLSDYQGEPNTRANGEKIRARTRSALIEANVVQAQDLTVRVVPVGYHEILIMISVTAVSTPNNRLELGTPVVINLLYDSIEKGIFFTPINQTDRDFRTGG